jgi:hypothetical protein
MKMVRKARKAAAERDGQTEDVPGLGNINVTTSARTLICKGLDAGTDPVALRSFFAQFGQVVEVKMVPVGKQGLSEAYVQFSSADAADAVLAPENIERLPCEVHRMVIKGKKDQQDGTLQKVFRGHAITVMNLPYQPEAHQLEEYFGDFGPILHIKIPQPFMGTCDVYFTDEEWLESVLVVKDHSVDGVPVDVIRKEKSNQHQHAGMQALLPANVDDDVQVNTTHVWKSAQSGNR